MKLFMALCFLVVPACIVGQTTTYTDIVAGLTAKGHYTTFLDLLNTTGFISRINSSSHFTVFAPTDDAFAKLPSDALDQIKNDPARLNEVVGYHVTFNTFYVHGTQQDVVLKSSNNLPIRINTYSILHTVTADGVRIIEPNITFTRGYVHGLEAVLTPPRKTVMQYILNRTDISTFTSWVVDSNLINFITDDDDVTVFIPNNAAFQKLSAETHTYLNSHPSVIQEILRYHIVSTMTVFSAGMKDSLTLTSADAHHDELMVLGEIHVRDVSTQPTYCYLQGGLQVNHAKIVEKDISTLDGVIHIIDSVLIPYRTLVSIADQGIVVG
ncbi:periostin-like [Physella acuta]|uniref:periostin-like n=1 Tax=Physella acuta TaxID=109671 RepID=UPI0027DB0DDC|nr:periostin-like [Physella acuta]